MVIVKKVHWSTKLVIFYINYTV